MKKILSVIFLFLCLWIVPFININSLEFTVSSYNCGGISDHYDYYRAATMQKIIQERYNAEPAQMAQIEKIQQTALKVLFSQDGNEKRNAEELWNSHYKDRLNQLISPALNQEWLTKSEEAISTYRVRPIELRDQEVTTMLLNHLQDLTQTNGSEVGQMVEQGRKKMSERIFRHFMKYDIICLQEATYLAASQFPQNYAVSFAPTDHSINGVAWNKERFELVEEIGDILGKAYAVKLLEKDSGKTVLVASAHLTGCHPFVVVSNGNNDQKDSDKGDSELRAVFQRFEEISADIKVIGMDSNVAATHPRMKIIQEYSYDLDAENFIEQTCANPNLIVNTRIDWIALQAKNASITNIPVMGIGLNSLQTNMSDHKPIAAKISLE